MNARTNRPGSETSRSWGKKKKKEAEKDERWKVHIKKKHEVESCEK